MAALIQDNFIMEQLNKIELKGNVGNNKVQIVGDNQVARFSVATNYVFKGKDGNAVIETTWHSVTAWGGRGMPDDLNKITKGTPVYVTGRLRQQRFTGQDGVERTIYEVMAKTVEILSSKEEFQPE